MNVDPALELLRHAVTINPNISAKHRALIIEIARSGKVPENAGDAEKESPVRCLRRAQVAERLGVSLRTVDKLARSGALMRRKLPGRARGVGFLESDVNALLLG